MAFFKRSKINWVYWGLLWEGETKCNDSQRGHFEISKKPRRIRWNVEVFNIILRFKLEVTNFYPRMQKLFSTIVFINGMDSNLRNSFMKTTIATRKVKYFCWNLYAYLYSLLAEVLGTARVNLQPAEHIKNASFSFYGFKPPPGPGGRGQGSNLHQNLPWTGRDVRGKFHQDRCGVWISTNPPHTNRHTNIFTPIFIFIIFPNLQNKVPSMEEVASFVKHDEQIQKTRMSQKKVLESIKEGEKKVMNIPTNQKHGFQTTSSGQVEPRLAFHSGFTNPDATLQSRRSRSTHKGPCEFLSLAVKYIFYKVLGQLFFFYSHA